MNRTDVRRFMASLKSRTQLGIVRGVNKLAQETLIDIKENVPVRTGRLQASYRFVQRASLKKPQAVLGSEVFYSRWQYPYRDNPHTGKKPTLFSGKPGSQTRNLVGSSQAIQVVSAAVVETIKGGKK